MARDAPEVVPISRADECGDDCKHSDKPADGVLHVGVAAVQPLQACRMQQGVSSFQQRASRDSVRLATHPRIISQQALQHQHGQAAPA